MRKAVFLRVYFVPRECALRDFIHFCSRRGSQFVVSVCTPYHERMRTIKQAQRFRDHRQHGNVGDAHDLTRGACGVYQRTEKIVDAVKAAGISEALGYGENFRAMLILQGLQEMVSLGKKLGAQEKTFFGPSGLGDLILTATSRQSRNYRLGIQLVENSQNKTGAIIEKDTFEGVSTAAGAYFLTRKFNLRLPIIEGVYRVIYENKNPKEFLKEIQESDIC